MPKSGYSKKASKMRNKKMTRKPASTKIKRFKPKGKK